MGRAGRAGGGTGRGVSSSSSSSRSFSSRSSSSSSSRGGGRSGSSSRGVSSSSYGAGASKPKSTSALPPRPRGYYESGPIQVKSWFQIIWIAMTIVCITTALTLTYSSRKVVTVSTVNREPLLASASVESSNWYEDHVDWITNASTLTSGMKKFYKATGVQPYLILTDNVNGKGYELTDAEAEAYLEEVYDSLFADEGHLILLFMEYADSEYKEYIYAGNLASSVIDLEAQEIIYDFVNYYYTSDLDDNSYFAVVFEKSAERIMRKTVTGLDITKMMIAMTGLILGIIIIGVLIVNKKMYEAQKVAEERQILQTPLSNLEDDSLKNKYN